MPKALLRDLRMYTACKQLRRVGVAQIVEPDTRQRGGASDEPHELMREDLRHQRASIDLRDDMRIVSLSESKS